MGGEVRVIEVPATFRAMPRWWHDGPGRTWLDELPGIVAERCERWGLDVDGGPLHGSNALVVPVRRSEESFALRLAPPGDDVAGLAAALGLWRGRGTVRLVDADVEERTLLLERLDASRSLESEPVAVRIDVLADLVRTLAVPVGAEVRSTAEVAAEQASSTEAAWEALGRPMPRRRLDVALAHARERAAATPAPEAVDGDLHAGQVLGGVRARWVVVDPDVLRGDREYDVGRVLWTNLDDLPRDADVRRALERFADRAEVPRERAVAWAVLRSTSYLLWGLAHGLTEDPERCRRLLDLFC